MSTLFHLCAFRRGIAVLRNLIVALPILLCFIHSAALAQAQAQAVNSSSFAPFTLLNEVGRLNRPIPANRVAAWKRQLHRGHIPANRAANLHLWLGEYELAQNEAPLRALWHFRQAQQLSHHGDCCYGLAEYDCAIVSFYRGAYTQAADAFHRLLQPMTSLPGYNRHACALWYRHASACAGYHAEHARMGITEPPSLDPFCGLASLAACMRQQKLPCDKKSLLAACRATGFGSTLLDLRTGAGRLGAAAWIVKADDEGIMALPKPLVAYVEHDHFVALVRADSNGVSYLCSDCGAWPGGRRNLTWKQWRALNPGIYLAVARKGSPLGKELAAASTLSQYTQPGVQVASLQVTPGVQSLAKRIGMASLLKGHVILYVGGQAGSCGDRAISLQCPNSDECPLDCPCDNTPSSADPTSSDAGDSGGSGDAENADMESLVADESGDDAGSSAGDPVNLATGEEEYHAPTDLVVYNPIGPSVVWSRLYNSLRGDPDESDIAAYGGCWSYSYNLQVLASNNSTILYFVEPNGGKYQFVADYVPWAPSPHAHCSPVEPGVPMQCYWDYDPVKRTYSFTFTHKDRSQWIFSSQNNYLLTRIVDRNGNSINFVRKSGHLAAITDSNNQPLLTIARNANQNITSISDRYGRSIYYNVVRYNNVNVPSGFQQYTDGLVSVSQVVPTGTTNPPARFTYGYQLMGNLVGSEQIPTLISITVPSPTGTGTSTTTFKYDSQGVYIQNIVDANGNIRSYQQVDQNHTRVIVQDPNGNTVYSYTVGFDSQMRETSRTDGTNRTVIRTMQYAADNDFHPASVTDGNQHTTQFTWDQFSNLQTRISPRNITTTYTWDSSVFPLGELKQVQEGAKSPTSFDYFEPSGLVKTITSPLPGTTGSSSTVTTAFTYDTLGNTLTVTTPGNDTVSAVTTTLNYTSDGSYQQPAAIGQPLTSTDNLGHVTHFRYDSQSNPTTIVDALGSESDFSYNIANQKTMTVRPAIGDISGQISVSRSALVYNSTTQTYNGTLTLTNSGAQSLAGSLAVVLTNLTPGVTLADSTGVYVGSPYLLANSTSLAPGQSLSVTVKFNNPAQASVNYGVQTYAVTAGRAQTINSYLYPGGPLTMATAYDESGNSVRQVIFAYGAEDELLSVTGSTEPVVYSYDAAYRLHKLFDGNGNPTAYLYNRAGWLKQITYPNGDNIQFQVHDPDGNVLSRLDGRGIRTNLIYNDPEDRLTNVQYKDSVQYPNLHLLNVVRKYDDYERLIEMDDGAGTMTWSYDDLDLVTGVTTIYKDASGNALPAQTVSYLYNPDGSRNMMATSAGIFAYSHDAAQRLRSLTNPFNETTQWSYLDNNWRSAQQMGSGVVTEYAWNRRGFLNDLTHYASTGTLLADYGTMLYDSVGNRAALTASLPAAPAAYSGLTSYLYDIKDELKQEQSTRAGGYTDVFGYDPAGNPTTFRGVSHNFNADNQFKDNGFVYDGEGNPTTYQGAAFAFDPEDRLVAVGTTLTAGYRADGLRAWKQTVNGRTYFIYDGIQPILELDGTGAVTAVNTFGATGLLSRHTGAGSVFYTFDPQGSVAQRLDAYGNVLTSSMYDAFGVGSSTVSASDPFEFGAQWGYYSDRETGLVLLGLRHYDPMTGRFLNRDPIRYAGGINLYGYVGNEPVIRVDPVGTGWWGVASGGLTILASGLGIAGVVATSPGLLIAAGIVGGAAGAAVIIDAWPSPRGGAGGGEGVGPKPAPNPTPSPGGGAGPTPRGGVGGGEGVGGGNDPGMRFPKGGGAGGGEGFCP